MADRAPYAFATEEAPAWGWAEEPGDAPAGLVRMGQGLMAIPFVAALASAFALPGTGTFAEELPTWLSLALLAGASWAYAVGCSAMSRRFLATRAGAAACVLVASVGLSEMWVRAADVATAMSMAEAPVVGWVAIAAAVVLSSAMQVSVDRQRASLWQEVGWSWVDGLAHRAAVRQSWWLAHLGADMRSDRVALVTPAGLGDDVPGDSPRRRRFVADKALGLLAPLPAGEEGDVVVDAIRADGWDIEPVTDAHGIMRSHEYPGAVGALCDPPTRGITAAEYYGRMP